MIQSSDLSADGTNKRIDAEFFSKHFVANQSMLKRCTMPKESLDGVTKTIDVGHVGPMADEYIEAGVPLLLTQNVGQFRVDYANCIRVSEGFHQKLKKSQIFPGDCLIARSGTIGNAAFVLDVDPQPLNSADIIIVRADPAKVTNGYLAAFLNSPAGAMQIERLTSGGVQGHINLKSIEHLIVPLPSKGFQDCIQTMVREGMLGFHEADKIHAKAEQTLLQVLGLEGWKPPEPLTYTRRASEALAAGRVDAEHFRPKFAALLAKMKEHGEVVRLGDCLRFCERGRQPQYAEEGLPVINSRHVRTNNVVIDEGNRFATEDAAQQKLCEEDSFTIKKGDLLINGTGVGTMGRCAPYLREDKALPDNHVTILRMKPETGIEPVFLSVQLNSIIGQMQVEQYFKGSSGQIELYPSEIKEFRIWLAPQKIQQQIKSHLEQAHQSRQEAQALLAKAKRAVEVAIEEGEEKALTLLTK